MAISTQKYYCIVFREIRQHSWRKLIQIAENSVHNIDPWNYFGVFLPTANKASVFFSFEATSY
jgi:hypothetical protein